MLLSIALSNLVYLLLPAVISANVITSEDSADLAGFDIKRLSTPLRNLLPKEKAITLASTPSGSNGDTLNSTNSVGDTLEFEATIDIPGLGGSTYFVIKGNMNDKDASATVQFWLHATFDRRIGVFHGDLNQGVDMTPSASSMVFKGESALFVGPSGGYTVLVFEAKSGTIHVPNRRSTSFPAFSKAIKRWKVGTPESMEDVPNTSGVQTLSSNAGVDT